MTSNITLNAAINPDFGQIEQDPSEFNLTAYETYFREKRPFFIEGFNLFKYRLMFGDNDSERLFYSRRIGRAPQFYPLDSGRWSDTDDFYEHTPKFTKIIGSAKITGRTSNGWSIGVLEALTDKENAQVELPSGERASVAVEPRTNYLVARALKDYNGGRSTIGGIVTSVVRDLPNGDFDYMNELALSGGIDFSHRWSDGDYEIEGNLTGSHIRGSEEAMLEAQTSSARYFQRPDAHYLEIDSTKTNMSGMAAKIWGGKFGGEPWRWAMGYKTMSPGFEVNDIGFMQATDEHLAVFWASYRDFDPGKIIRQYSTNFNLWNNWTYGGEPCGVGGNVNGWAQFMNYWELYGGIGGDVDRTGFNILRGGPAVTIPSSMNSWYGFNSDYRKRLAFGYDGNFGMNTEKNRSHHLGPYITVRPSGRFDMTVSTGYLTSTNAMQYVDDIDGRYILGHLDMKVFDITARLNFTLTPDMSLQLYGMPFIAAGTYSDYREVTDPRAARYEDRFAPFDYLAHGDDPDFNFKQFRSNMVFRWEYSPGSTVFLVWSSGATDYEEEYGRFSLGRDIDRLFSTAGDNTFMIKINKWFSL